MLWLKKAFNLICYMYHSYSKQTYFYPRLRGVTYLFLLFICFKNALARVWWNLIKRFQYEYIDHHNALLENNFIFNVCFVKVEEKRIVIVSLTKIAEFQIC